ncbi:MAG: Arm DNA-binding domain-containing protein [Sphingomonas sp.]|uniref:Arm DNA-binding domain-containing protein n=1 Tax=Sphingomonas sp. TaxID=28214 RepID=UPI003567B6BA
MCSRSTALICLNPHRNVGTLVRSFQAGNRTDVSYRVDGQNAKPGRHTDGRSLCLLVKDRGAKTWVLRMQRQGRRRDYDLGSALGRVAG